MTKPKRASGHKPTSPIVIVMFGLPGAGKTFVAKQVATRGLFFHDGDSDLPSDMKLAISKAEPVTPEMRGRFIDALIEHVGALAEHHPRIVVAQTFLKQIHRDQFIRRFPAAHFVLVSADEPLRVARLERRINQPLEPAYAHAMVTAFDPPQQLAATIRNAGDAEDLRDQIDAMLELL
jgi:gluconate kinase